MVGIPIYGAEPARHDYVVQVKGAFNRPIPGILNLAQLGQRIEVRVVLHKQTAPALPEIAEFIARNLPFVDQVALMGVAMIGLARANTPSSGSIRPITRRSWSRRSRCSTAAGSTR